LIEMDAHRRRAWEALEIGPLWRLRPPPADPSEPLTWTQLEQTVSGCTACALAHNRQQTVFGVGPQPAAWMLVGDAPDQHEEASAEPFAGPAGQLLDQMLAAISVNRSVDVFATNALKCRPPANRDPSPEEVSRCQPYLKRQVDLVQPRLILALGQFAAHSLLGTDANLASLRGVVHRYASAAGPIPLVVTYHPAYLLRHLPEKARSWADLRLARRTFDTDPGAR
jgi:DNA polymerase